MELSIVHLALYEVLKSTVIDRPSQSVYEKSIGERSPLPEIILNTGLYR